MSSATPSDAPIPPKPSRTGSTRPPTLTELAARMSERAPAATSQTGPSPSSSRPRLPAALLARTNSSQGQPTTATSSVTSPDSATPGSDPSLDAATERLSATTLEDAKKSSDDAPVVHEKDKAPRGYKNVPSLNEITERLGNARTRTSENVAKAAAEKDAAKAAQDLEDGEIEESEDQSKKGGEDKGHPLQHPWALYHDSKSRGGPPGAAFHQTSGTGEQSPYIHPPNTASGDYEAGLTAIGEFNTVEDFCRYFNWLKPPSQLERNSNYHLFKDGIKPMWEDPANSNGGKWVITMRSNPELLDRCWNWLAMALVGEELDERDEICGAVVSLRAKIDRIQLWLRSKDDIERINSIGKKLVKLLDLSGESGIGLEFQYNTEDRPTHTKFISIVPPAQTGSYFRPSRGPASALSEADTPPASAPGVGGFGAGVASPSGFGAGGGMGSFSTTTSAWRSRGAAGTAATPSVAAGPGRSVSGFAAHSRSSSAGGGA